jgi:hypothetical protein
MGIRLHRIKEPIYVYFVRRPSDGTIKIGRSIDPLPRLWSIESKVGESLELLAIIKDPPPHGLCDHLEYRLHRRFGHLRIGKSEWFHPGTDLVRFIAMANLAEGMRGRWIRKGRRAVLSAVGKTALGSAEVLRAASDVLAKVGAVLAIETDEIYDALSRMND